MNFMNGMKETMNNNLSYNVSITENGAVGYRTTGKKLLDFNFQISSFRNKNASEVVNKFVDAFYEDKLTAVKMLFYSGDVREGLGERRLFRTCMTYLGKNHRDIAKAVIELIPEYSRWDNVLCLLDTDLADDVVSVIKQQLVEDMQNCVEGKSISLCAKWMPSANASSKETKRLASIIITKMGISEKQYRKMLSKLRSYLKVVEVSMSKKEWKAIDYATVPSRANLIYNGAFLRNDEERRRAYLASLEKGETKINAGVLFPHDIVSRYTTCDWRRQLNKYDATLEELWKALPDLVQGNGNTICVADGSGSMTHRLNNSSVMALDVANALAIYFAERSSGQFKDKYITFSSNPKLVDFSKAKSLREKIEIAFRHNEVADTNIEKVFQLILDTAVRHNMSQDDIPANILILSDMEFNSCATCNSGYRLSQTLFDKIAKDYAAHGYKLPRLVFWNICSRTGTIPVKENDLGVALVSGFSPNIVKMVMSNSTDPLECLLEQINSKRYDPVENAIKDLVA